MWAPTKIENIAAWALVATPILWQLVSIALLQMSFSSVSAGAMLIFFAGNSLLCAWDVMNLRKAGLAPRVSTWFAAIFLVPAYLVSRTLRSKQTWWIPSLWVASFLLAIAMMPLVAIAGGVEYEADFLEDEIESDLAEYYLLPNSRVSCPDPAIAPVGSIIECDVFFADGTSDSAIIDVLDWTGTWNWSM
ncbi:hypothetical protein [Pseudactinotalea sp. HY158]|uniref:hypothetical protein n=1 Tax=Pseudactinotalea sp. HY158 TaxID=2654547 RepID=UPI00129C38F9|nr:hypothetical protein [Pseudactinotalea sp. HY158]QGH69959.1 hypothetical protein GCE65_10920 [Pseudactinotalea sp. HY158]